MLAPDTRTTLVKQLTPPADCVFEHLVATTFTLDLESALLPCLALAGSTSIDSHDTVETIAAVRASIGRVDIFHQVGRIAVPNQRSRLFSLLEHSIHGVTRDHGLFHPKIWLAHYRSPTNEALVRLLVLSRNLTKDRSWDIAMSLDGEVGTSPHATNKPLADLLRYLGSAPGTMLSSSRSKRLLKLANDLRYVTWDLPLDATGLSFHVFGIPNIKQPNPDFGGYRHLLVSPFLNDFGIDRLAANARGDLIVVSRQESFDSLGHDTANRIDQAYVLSPTAGIPADDEPVDKTTFLTGLHAKLYAVERSNTAHVFVGSANATQAAFTSNTEILVELTGKSKTYGVDALAGTDHGFGSILESTKIEAGTSDPDSPQEILDGFVQSLASIPLNAVVSLDKDDLATLEIASSVPLPSFSSVLVTLSLLTDSSTATKLVPAELVQHTLRDVQLCDVTAFMVLTAEDEAGIRSSTVIKAALQGDVPRRLDEIVTNEVTSADSFRRFLELLLAFGTPIADGQNLDGPQSTQDGQSHLLEGGIFEQLLKASLATTEVLDQLGAIVSAIIAKGDPHSVLPDGFEHLWSAISSATARKDGHRG